MPPKRTPVKNTPAKKLEVEQDDELDALVHLRGQAVAMLVQLQQELKGLPRQERTGPRVKLSQKKLEMAYSEFGAIHEKVMQLVDANARGPHDAQKREVLAIYDSIFMTLEAWVEEMALSTPGPSNVVTPTGQNQHQQPVVIQQPLPRIIPTFDGKYESWERFKLMFRDIVDKSNEPARMKLYHLEKALVGSAAGILDEKTIQDGNYNHAWEILKERFEDKRRMVDIHVGGLLKVQKVAKESHTELRALVETVVGHVENLKYLGQEFSGVSEQIVVYLLSHALDGETKKLWEATVRRGELPKYEATIQFLKDRVSVLERCEETSEPAPKQRDQTMPAIKPAAQKANAATTTSNTERRCELCKEPHPTHKCGTLTGLSVDERKNKVKDNKLCLNCLRTGHGWKNCTSKYSCGKCRQRHHSLLHDDSEPTPVQKPGTPQNVSPSVNQPPVVRPAAQETQPSTSATCNTSQTVKTVMLMTALVHLRDEKNRPVPCRLLLDNGSQVNFIAEQMAQRLNTRRVAANVPICGIGAVKTYARESMVVQLQSRHSSFAMDVECLIVPKVTGMIPSTPISISDWPIPADIQLADPNFHTPDRIDMLLGVSMFIKLLKSGQLHLSEKLPVLCETYLGWVVAGDVEDTVPGPQFSHHATLDEISEAIERQVEDIDSAITISTEQEECEAFFRSTHDPDLKRQCGDQMPHPTADSSWDSSGQDLQAPVYKRQLYAPDTSEFLRGQLIPYPVQEVKQPQRNAKLDYKPSTLIVSSKDSCYSEERYVSPSSKDDDDDKLDLDENDILRHHNRALRQQPQNSAGGLLEPLSSVKIIEITADSSDQQPSITQLQYALNKAKSFDKWKSNGSSIQQQLKRRQIVHTISPAARNPPAAHAVPDIPRRLNPELIRRNLQRVPRSGRLQRFHQQLADCVAPDGHPGTGLRGNTEQPAVRVAASTAPAHSCEDSNLPNVRPGLMVLLEKKDAPLLQWDFGINSANLPGSGRKRSNHRHDNRPPSISKLSILPIEDNETIPAGTSPQPGGRMLAADVSTNIGSTVRSSSQIAAIVDGC